MSALPSLMRDKIERWATDLIQTSPLATLARAGELTPRGLALYLESLRYLFQHSQRNLQLAAQRSETMGLSALAQYFNDKVHEEHGHDAWASNDLAQLPAASVANLPAADSIVRLVELQRSLIVQHPICFVVYALWAEYFTVLIGDEWLDVLSGCGFDRSQVSAVAKHVDADREHAALGFIEVDRLWLGDPEAAVLLDVIAQASNVFEQFCEEVSRQARAAA